MTSHCFSSKSLAAGGKKQFAKNSFAEGKPVILKLSFFDEFGSCSSLADQDQNAKDLGLIRQNMLHNLVCTVRSDPGGH
jgi:hypothetical protein